MIKHTIQLNKNECGIACLKMFYDLFEVDISYNEILEKIELNESGISFEEMLKFLNSLALFKAYEIPKDSLKTMLPAIILLKKKKKSHYVVVWKYEEGYYYVSDPNYFEIKRIKEKKFIKNFSGYILFNQRKEINITKTKCYKIKYGQYKIPYIILSLLEVFLLTYSMMYLFSIKDFTIFKIYYFLIILFLNCIISLVKNICFNKIQKNLDDRTFDKKIKDNFNDGKINNINELRMNIQRGYYAKNDVLKLLTIIIPNVFIVIGSLVYFFSINIALFMLILVIFLLVFSINYLFSYLKNKKLYCANQEELKLNIYENKV